MKKSLFILIALLYTQAAPALSLCMHQEIAESNAKTLSAAKKACFKLGKKIGETETLLERAKTQPQTEGLKQAITESTDWLNSAKLKELMAYCESL